LGHLAHAYTVATADSNCLYSAAAEESTQYRVAMISQKHGPRAVLAPIAEYAGKEHNLLTLVDNLPQLNHQDRGSYNLGPYQGA
jgi:hypothetical protein